MTSRDNFAVQFAKHKDELEWLFMELYHNREGLEVLEREMAQAYNARSAELKALDKARSADPEWYKRGNMFGMTMYTDLFAGNLKELAKKLPYLKEQKLTYLHLMPHPHNDGGYAVEDFDTVDPHGEVFCLLSTFYGSVQTAPLICTPNTITCPMSWA